ncbi:MAG: chemotaxis-specific protein-glutamate methyltransferase CheB [Coxiellaceae bacterium]|nr:chemotaxis-specific protein-glutamate methyltransferase CheB [Coxiellaceae bacterium]
MIRVLIADDSKVVRMLLRALIENEEDFEIVGEAENGLRAVELTKRLRPNVITMDIRMPVMDGFEATEIIMTECPTPILVVSASVNDEDLKIAFNALQAGALGVIEKPPGLHGDDYDTVKQDLITCLRAYHDIKVVTRRKLIVTKDKTSERSENDGLENLATGRVINEVVAIGSSTGGPALLGDILHELPVNLPSPVLIVQHISEGFTHGLATWLNDVSQLIVKVAEQNEVLRPGVVYIAPYGKHTNVVRRDGILYVSLVTPAEKSGFCPSVDALFKSVADVCPGHALGIILTGMGRDGAAGLLEMRNACCMTIAQDEETCIVYGMPKEAMALDAACLQLPDYQIAQAIRDNLTNVQDSRKRGRV